MKFWKWFAIVLVVLNLFLLSTIWFSPGHKHFGPPQHGMGGPGDFIIKELAFTESQKTEFNKLRTAHHEGVMKLQDSGRDLHKNFFDNLKKDAVDEKTVEEQAMQIAANQQQIEMLTFHHFQDVRKLCDEKQKIRFDQIIDDVLRQMSHPQGPPH